MVMDKLHIFPVERNGRKWSTTHCTDKTGMCWCKPEIKQVCPEADDDGKCKERCWRCQGWSLVDVYDESLNTFIVHKTRQLMEETAYFCSCGRAIIDRSRSGEAWCGACKKLTRTRI